jgi:CRISPR/Cas system CSM-associated protein Csm3 (group 7 of RAMP superfamily)
VNFSEFKNRYIIEGIFTVENALHIGSGEVEGDKDAPFIKRGITGNDYYIPGSSFRGYLRSKVEGLIGLGLEVEGKQLSDLHIKALFGFTNLEEKDQNEMGKILDIKNIKKIKSAMGRIHIADMPVSTEEVEHTRDGIKIDRNTGTTEDGAKFDYNVLSEGTKFKFTMTLENVEDYELDLIRLGLLFILNGDIFGGKTSRGIGKCALILNKAKYVKENIKDFVLTGKMKETDNAMGILTTNIIK